MVTQSFSGSPQFVLQLHHPLELLEALFDRKLQILAQQCPVNVFLVQVDDRLEATAPRTG
ncbi:MAG: hypothetical protein OES79_14475 [Planctomycetota bacterium]|nr:hypothetical protein [Planctomycetota bacterium]